MPRTALTLSNANQALPQYPYLTRPHPSHARTHNNTFSVCADSLRPISRQTPSANGKAAPVPTAEACIERINSLRASFRQRVRFLFAVLTQLVEHGSHTGCTFVFSLYCGVLLTRALIFVVEAFLNALDGNLFYSSNK